MSSSVPMVSLPIVFEDDNDDVDDNDLLYEISNEDRECEKNDLADDDAITSKRVNLKKYIFKYSVVMWQSNI